MTDNKSKKLIDGVKSNKLILTRTSATLTIVGAFFLGLALIWVSILLLTAVSDLAIITTTLWFIGLLVLGSVFVVGGLIIQALDKCFASYCN